MYGRSFEVDDKVMDSDFVLPIGKAKVEREGIYLFTKKYLRDFDNVKGIMDNKDISIHNE